MGSMSIWHWIIVAGIVIAPEWGYLLFALPHAVAALLFLADWWGGRAKAHHPVTV